MQLSIIIVNFNSNNYLGKCLESIYANPPDCDFEVIVVDNASTDDSISIVKNVFPQVDIILNENNKGFSAANNIGIKASQGKYILLLNHDTLIRNNALNVLLDFMSNNPDVGACGPKILNSDGTIQHQCKRGFPTPLSTLVHMAGFNKLMPKSKLFGHYLMTYIDINQINEVDSLSGSCMLIRKEILVNIGGLDELFFLYGEDLDLCYRIKQGKFKIYYVPQAIITHFGGVGSRAMSYKSIIEFYRSMIIFYVKHYKNKYGIIIKSLVFIGIYIKMIINITINSVRRDKFGGSKKPSRNEKTPFFN